MSNLDDIYQCKKLSIVISLLWTAMMLLLFLTNSLCAWKCMKYAILRAHRTYTIGTVGHLGLRGHVNNYKNVQIDCPPSYTGKNT